MSWKPVLAACVAVAGVAVAVPAVLSGESSNHRAASGEPTPTSTPTAVPPVLHCPANMFDQPDEGSPYLPGGATAARLCGGGEMRDAAAPRDLLTTGLDTLVDSVNAQPKGSSGCYGPIGDHFLLLLTYPDGTERRVSLDFSGCGSIGVGGVGRLNPDKPYQQFLDLVRSQRKTATPPVDVPAPACLPQNSNFSPIADPAEMVAALMCVSYNDGGTTTSTTVSPSDLETILEAWRNGAKTTVVKGPGCGPTTPTWVLSGVTQWGDPVQITAECNRPTNGPDWVEFTRQAQQVVDGLVARAGVHIDDGAKATTAWSFVLAWLTNVNARATVSYDRTAADIAKVANAMWVRDPWLPEGELNWDLLAASRTNVAGWEQAWRVPARTPQGEAVFIVVRHSKDQPWRILRLIR